MINKIYTIGHSTRKLEEFIEILKEYKIKILVDVRSIPKSRYNPQFNSIFLKDKLKRVGIKYLHLEMLGGLRYSKKDSINMGWKNSSFRGYADYMQTKEFLDGLKELISKSKKEITAIMCAEAVPWRCHRSLISDALLIRKIKIIHIINKNSDFNHKLTSFAKVKGKVITYPNL
jgi:uncharacterized protein (DUF488 family)